MSTPVGTDQPHLKDILKKCDEILDYPGWDRKAGHPKGYNYNQAERELLDILHNACDKATNVLGEPETRFESLLRSHLCELFVLRDKPSEELARRVDEDGSGGGLQQDGHEPTTVHLEDQIMRYYFNVCGPRTVERVRRIQSLGGEHVALLSAYWVTMIFRSLCWYSLHNFKYKFAPVDA